MDAIAKPERTPLSTRDLLLQRYYLKEDDEAHLRDYWQIILKHRWTVLTFFAIIATISTIYTFTLTPLFRASATIKIDRGIPNVLSFQTLLSAENALYDADYMGTQQKLLQSRSLSKRVADTLKSRGMSITADHNPSGLTELQGVLVSWFTNPFRQPTSSVPQEVVSGPAAQQADSQTVNALLSMLTVEPIRASNLIRISFNTPSPQLSSLLANTWSKAFIDQSLELKYNATTQVSEWLTKQLQELMTRLEQSEARLHGFAKEKGILTLGEKKDIVTTKLADLSEALTKAQGERIAKEALYRQSQGQGFESIPVVLENNLITNLKNEYYKLESEYHRLSETYKPDYPKMARMREGLNGLKQRLDTEIRRVIDAIKEEYEAALRKEKLLQVVVDDQKRLAVKLNQDFIQYDILKREVDMNRQIYSSVLERQKQAGVTQGLTASNIQIVDPAEIPRVPFSPNKTRNVLLGLVLGLAVGTGLAFFFNYLDNTVKSPEDLERALGIPSLALIPTLSTVTSRKGLKEGKPTNNGRPVFEMIAHRDLRSILTEAFRNLRTSILFSSPGAPPKSILFTSAVSAEGKTGVSINTSLTLAQLGGSVLLIDADMRRPRCHHFFDLPMKPGLADYLTGHADLVSIIKRTPIPYLYCVPAGTIPVNPAELLGSSRMKETIELLSQRFDYIVVDSPPVLAVADALILSTLVKGVILVAHGGRTPREMVQRALKSLIGLDATVLGAVLNNVDIRGNGYSHYYHQYYLYQTPHDRAHEIPPEERELPSDFPASAWGTPNKPA